MKKPAFGVFVGINAIGGGSGHEGGSASFKGVVECFDLGEMQGFNRDWVLTSVL